MRSRALTRPWCPHFGQTLRFFSRSVRYSTASHAGHLTHRPSGTAFLLAPGVDLIRGGRSFWSQLIFSPDPSSQCRLLGGLFDDAVDGAAYCSEPGGGAPGRFGGRTRLDLLDDAAADHHGVG